LTSGVWAQHVATVDGKPVSVKEFMWVFKKNHSGSSNATLTELESYLNLYLNFKLKALDARSLGLQNDPDYIAEVKNYEQALLAQKKMAKSHKEYDLIMAEYRDAVLMFALSEQMVWKKSKSDIDAKRLEDEWIAQLQKKYKVTINHNELKKLVKP
jgi:hypothetical protein